MVELRVEITTMGNILMDLTAAPSSDREPYMATSSTSRSTPRGKARLEGLHLRLSPRQKPAAIACSQSQWTHRL